MGVHIFLVPQHFPQSGSRPFAQTASCTKVKRLVPATRLSFCPLLMWPSDVQCNPSMPLLIDSLLTASRGICHSSSLLILDLLMPIPRSSFHVAFTQFVRPPAVGAVGLISLKIHDSTVTFFIILQWFLKTPQKYLFPFVILKTEKGR